MQNEKQAEPLRYVALDTQHWSARVSELQKDGAAPRPYLEGDLGKRFNMVAASQNGEGAESENERDRRG